MTFDHKGWMKIPLDPPFPKGELVYVPLFDKEGSGEIFR